jgi:hypothetical protein
MYCSTSVLLCRFYSLPVGSKWERIYFRSVRHTHFNTSFPGNASGIPGFGRWLSYFWIENFPCLAPPQIWKAKAFSRYSHPVEMLDFSLPRSTCEHDKLQAYILLSINNKMQRYTIFFITVNALHVSGGFSPHHQEFKSVHTTSGTCQACLLLPLAVAASKLDIYQMPCLQFWAPDDGRRNRLKRVKHWQ